MTIKDIHYFNELNKQYRYIQKIYFLKCRELADIENRLKEVTEQINQAMLYSRAKLKNSTYKHKFN